MALFLFNRARRLMLTFSQSWFGLAHHKRISLTGICDCVSFSIKLFCLTVGRSLEKPCVVLVARVDKGSCSKTGCKFSI